MPVERFEKLAHELAERDRELPARLRDATRAAGALREQALEAVEAFRLMASALGAEHLTHLCVTPVEADEKHVDCVSFRVERGRSVLLCVAIAGDPGKFRFVGPFRRGKVEGPCADLPLRGADLEQALEDAVVALIREASA